MLLGRSVNLVDVLFEDEDENDVRVVEHTDAYARMAAMSKEQLKSFMVLTCPSYIVVYALLINM